MKFNFGIMLLLKFSDAIISARFIYPPNLSYRCISFSFRRSIKSCDVPCIVEQWARYNSILLFSDCESRFSIYVRANIVKGEYSPYHSYLSGRVNVSAKCTIFVDECEKLKVFMKGSHLTLPLATGLKCA